MRGLASLLIDCNATAQTEITNLNLPPVKANEDISRLQVSVDHVASMHRHQAQQDLSCEASDLLIRQHNTLGVDESVEITIHELE
jgi:hypothetical protein